MRSPIVSLICATALVLTVEPSFAQDPQPGGFWWGLSASYGRVYVACEICDADRGAAVALGIAVGGTVSDRLRLGGEVNGWTSGDAGVDEYAGSIGAVAYWHPAERGSLYLKGGLGYMVYRIDDDESALTSGGFGPQIGAGYRFRITRSTLLEPHINAIITVPTSDLELDGDRQANRVSLSLVQVGLGLVWH